MLRYARNDGGWRLAAAVFASLLLSSAQASDQRCVVDDIEHTVCLPKPAERIIALSPGATELLFAAGAGHKVIAAVTFSDFPEEAKALPRIGSYNRFDMEAIVAAQPDLIIAWKEGNPREQVEQLRELGFPVYHGDQRDFLDIASTIQRLGILAGTELSANTEATRFLDGIAHYRDQFQTKAPVRTFYQVWVNPLMTANRNHFIGHAITLCGGDNIFADLDRLTPRIGVEAVLAENPEVIIAGGMGEDDPSWLNAWRPYSNIVAVQKDNLFFVPPSTLQRPSPRLLDGIDLLCQHLETARGRR
ncbi:iron complex transport system substrate-binding protein [Litorivivens lipolytica]|uniref:Iron complex transport system substrate-binding protein n=1 Tax=Litorivivens lipolytica TaxID=1524264 RepID=A0A7W4W6N7_9GAMM|nr:cobalamin-binding protein [Litorivivens lipolytica]MBB3048043.1 iron complex transport system substrate-binding protein [Litorivivens lipolytica]